MKKAIVFSVSVCAVSWALAAAFLLLMGDAKDNKLILTAFESFYMFLPMVVALVLQKINGEGIRSTGLVNFHFSRTWIVALLTPFAAVGICLLICILLPGVSFHFGPEQLMEQFSLGEEESAALAAQFQSMPPAVLILIEVLSAIMAGCTINALFAFGEEYGWRNYLVDALKGRSFWKKALFIGLVWGIWHAPLILNGYNYPQHPVAGVGMMCVVCILLGTIELYFVLKTGSVIPAAIIHGSFNAVCGVILMLVHGGNDLLIGMTGLAGFAASGITILCIWLYDRRHDRIMAS